MNRETWVLPVVIVVAILALAVESAAQAPGAGLVAQENEIRRIEGQTQALSRAGFFGTGSQVRPGTEWGGWSAVTVMDLSNLDHSKALPDTIDRMILADQRLWVHHRRDGRTGAYVRLRKLNFSFDTLPGVTVLDLSTKEQVDLDLGYVEFPAGDLQLRLGRQFLGVGRGLTLADALDGLRLSYASSSAVSVESFAGLSVKRTDNLDTQVRGFDRGHNDRVFLGTQATYRTEANMRVYGYALDQIDRTRSEDPTQDAADFRYQSWYWGVGGDGMIGRRTHWALEMVSEGGTSNGTRALPCRAEIDSRATLLAVEHVFDGECHPTLTFDYAFGSGDPNRLSVTDSQILGPISPLGDKNFLYFGQWDGGLALQPRLSNLVVYRLGFCIKPLAHALDYPSEVTTGFKVSSYSKDVASGPISDPLATLPSKDVGWAGDAYAAWRVVSDVNLLLEGGTFKPSTAYPATMRDLTSRVAATVCLTY